MTPNPNEIRDYKYVSKEELQAMFEDPSEYLLLKNVIGDLTQSIVRKLLYAVVQAHRP